MNIHTKKALAAAAVDSISVDIGVHDTACA
jgi:hypothetical protein